MQNWNTEAVRDAGNVATNLTLLRGSLILTVDSDSPTFDERLTLHDRAVKLSEEFAALQKDIVAHFKRES